MLSTYVRSTLLINKIPRNVNRIRKTFIQNTFVYLHPTHVLKNFPKKQLIYIILLIKELLYDKKNVLENQIEFSLIRIKLHTIILNIFVATFTFFLFDFYEKRML